MKLKEIPDEELTNKKISDIAEEYFYNETSVRCEILRRGLKNVYINQCSINITREEFETMSMNKLCEREGVSRCRIYTYAMRTYNMTQADIKQFELEREAKRRDLSKISDDELLKSFTYLMKTYGVLQTSITPERNKRGLVKRAIPPIKKEIRTMSDFELFENSLNNLANAYNVSKDTISRERKRRRENGETSYKANHKNRKLEHVTTAELFALSIPSVCKKYNVGETTVTMERRRRKQ